MTTKAAEEWPGKIWLQRELFDEPFAPNAEITWCWHSINDADVEYWHADTVRRLMQEGRTPTQISALLGER